MAKVFPCLFPMGQTDNDNYTNNDKITLFINQLFTNCKQTNKHHRRQLGRLSVDLRWSLISTRLQNFTGRPIVVRDWMLAELAQCPPTSKLARKIVLLSARQGNSIRMAFHWRADSRMRLDAGWVPYVFSQYYYPYQTLIEIIT